MELVDGLNSCFKICGMKGDGRNLNKFAQYDASALLARPVIPVSLVFVSVALFAWN